ncbi:MAG: hypothetical protein M1831_005490 [Alyxoria varia]|nr:MAG: hypothetical protein M1831_005490 [Alyxoria varia]
MHYLQILAILAAAATPLIAAPAPQSHLNVLEKRSSSLSKSGGFQHPLGAYENERRDESNDEPERKPECSCQVPGCEFDTTLQICVKVDAVAGILKRAKDHAEAPTKLARQVVKKDKHSIHIQ